MLIFLLLLGIFNFYYQKVEEEELKELFGVVMIMMGDFMFKDDGYIELVLRMLGFMCDNQYFDIQVKIKGLWINML